MTSPILVFGAGGRVGGVLMGMQDIAYMRFHFQTDTDITDPFAVMKAVGEERPRAIVNLAACTLPHAEKPEVCDEALRVNGDALQTLAKLGVPIVTLSTDCVFDGEKAAPYKPDDYQNPLNHYGFSKQRGEFHLELSPISPLARPPHIILRTTGVYLRGKPNFLETVLSKARAGETLECVSDSLYTPTDARELARAILTATERVIEDPSVSGTYHFAGPDVMSYIDFARLVAEEAGVALEIRPVTMADREKVEGFKRPKNAALNSDKFAETFGLRHRPTRECVRELLNPA